MIFRAIGGELKEFKITDYLSDKQYYSAIIKHIFSKELPSALQNISNLII